MTVNEYTAMYNKFEDMYNHNPCQMSRAQAFGKALEDGLITEEEYKQAREFAGKLWFYTGD